MKSLGRRLMALSLIALVITFIIFASAQSQNSSTALLQQAGVVMAGGVVGFVGGLLLWLLGVAFSK